jgi:hypothetical protein
MTSQHLRCPQCAAHVGQDAEWCTLCYTDLRPAPEPAPEPEPQPAPEPAAAAALPEADVQRPRGRHARRSPEPAQPSAEPGVQADLLAAVDVDAMFARLAAQSSSGLEPLAGRLDSPRSKVAAIVAGVAAVGVLLFVLMTVLGALL